MAKRAAKPVAVDPHDAARTKFLEQGDDPVIAKKALEDATAVSRALWLSFLTFGTYLVITFAGVTHRDLLLETPIKLPVLNAPLPLVTFFWVAPILFVIFHLYLLLSLKLLADQVHSYVGHMEELALDGDAQDRARLQLPNFVVVQVLGGTSGQVNSWAGRLMRFTAFLTLVAGPIILLLFAQLMFLPYHGWWVTMAQRVMVVVDLVFITYFWRAITRAPDLGFRFWPNVARASVVMGAFFVFMYPGENFYGALPKAIFAETGARKNHYEWGVLLNNLVLNGKQILDDEVYKKLDASIKEKGNGFWLKERNFAVLKKRDFSNAEFKFIDLREADMSESIFINADFTSASLDGANFNLSSMRGVSFQSAELKQATFLVAKLQGANLEDADLFGAQFAFASLQGASFNFASLILTNFDNAKLQGAALNGSKLLGANLDNANLQNASLNRASVWRSKGVPLMLFTNLNDLSRGAVTNIAYQNLLSYKFKLVPDQKIEIANLGLNELDPGSPDFDNLVDWGNLEKRMLAEPNRVSVNVSGLIELACDADNAPFVASGIVDGRLDLSLGDLDREAMPLVEKLLAGCPGAVGIDHVTINVLKALKDRFTSKPNPSRS